jgi:hypothetical protein
MTASIRLQSSLSATALAECWKLDAGHATTLQPRQPGVLRVTQGRLWATVDGPHAGHTSVLGDHVLQVGDQFTLQPGQRMVVEPLDAGGPVYFVWEPLASGRRTPTPKRSPALQPGLVA